MKMKEKPSMAPARKMSPRTTRGTVTSQKFFIRALQSLAVWFPLRRRPGLLSRPPLPLRGGADAVLGRDPGRGFVGSGKEPRLGHAGAELLGKFLRVELHADRVGRKRLA